MKFKIGDKVKISKAVSGLGADWVYSMNKRLGHEGIITSCHNTDRTPYYQISEAGGWDYTEEALELITETMTEKPQTFNIVGKEHQIKAISEDLKLIGYDFTASSGNWGYNYISNNRNTPHLYDSIEDFKELYISQEKFEKNVQFQLPQDYQKALDFAKEQLEHSYWTKIDQKISILSHNLYFRTKGFINFGCWAIPITMIDSLIDTIENDNDFKIGLVDENLILTKECDHSFDAQLSLEDLKNIRKQYNLHKWS